jgi:GMP synthase (glutamine-hydrolysing)
VTHPRPVLVVDYGAQYAQLIARRVREANVYSELVPHATPVGEMLARDPAAIILSGGPSSVYEPGAPQVDPALFAAGVPVFGICYGFQAMAQALGGEVTRTGWREYGGTTLSLTAEGTLLRDLDEGQSVWMSHGDCVTTAPSGFSVTAESPGSPVAAFEAPDRRLAGVQFHPEVGHTPRGQEVLERFLFDIAGIRPEWTTGNIIDEQVAAIRAQIGGAQVICGLSGGVDSAVAAALVHRAVGDQLTCVFVDHGLLRAGEAEQVEKDYVRATGIRLKVVDAADRFLSALAGVADPEQKRTIVGEVFVRVFEEEAAKAGPFDFLAQGTLYPDVIESTTTDTKAAAKIKTHHNVGGLPADMRFRLVEPLKFLFKDEVRAVGRALGLPAEIVERQPFPGPGLAVRVLGEVTREDLDLLRRADAIVRAEVEAAGLGRDVWQYFAVLLPVRSVGVMGDYRTYGRVCAIRAVSSEDAMTADWARLPYDLLARISLRIVNEVRGLTRVVYDVSSKPPATIEWE